MSNEIVKVENYKILQMDAASRAEVIQANTGALGISQFDFDRAKVPSGGGLQFQLDDNKAVPEIDGVIIAFQDLRVYWMDEFSQSGGGTPPDCISENCVQGIGDPGGNCTQCPFAQFKSRGAGQACQQRRILFIARPDRILPLALSLPPTSLRNVRRYFRIQLVEEGLPFYGVITRLGLEEEKNATGISFAKVTFKNVGVLDAETRAKFKAIHKELQPQVSQVAVAAAVNNEPTEEEAPVF